MQRAGIIGIGSYLPDNILTNLDLEKKVDTTEEWILSRTGIRERHYADEKTPTSMLATKAAIKALASAGIKAEELDFILVGTVCPDMMFPSTACLIQAALGAKKAAAFDLSAGCTGFIYGLELARSLIAADPQRKVLGIGAEELTKLVDWTDRNTCILFGDGAGAAVLASVDEPRGILATYLGADGSLGDLLCMPGGGSLHPATHETIDTRMHYIKMAGNEVFKHAVKEMSHCVDRVMEIAGVTKQDIDLLVPHQANIRIIEAVARRLDLPMDKVFVNIQKYGNTSSASIPIALDEASRAGTLTPGKLVLTVAFGAGFTYGAALMRW